MPQFDRFTLDDWVEYTQKQHHRTVDLSLDRVRMIWEQMHGVQPDFVVTVGGTNGKGSSVSMLEAVYRMAGKVTGAYTSPHLVSYNERIRINGQSASEQEICRGFHHIEQARRQIPLTYFEFGTLCALWLFNQYRVDIAILEVGMGGRLDAVNMIGNDIALITTIDLDHQQWLGGDREAIGREKAGIINPDGWVVCADPHPPDSLVSTARQRNAVLLQNGLDYTVDQDDMGVNWRSESPWLAADWRRFESLQVPFNGGHQVQNLGGVIATLALAAGRTAMTPASLPGGLGQAVLTGRCQVVSEAPQVIMDVAHNQQSVHELSTFLRRLSHPGGRTLAVFGALEDKAVRQITQPLMEMVDRWYLVSLPGDRGQSALDLEGQLKKGDHGVQTVLCDHPVQGYLAAMAETARDDRVLVFGSFHTVGDIIAFRKKTHISSVVPVSRPKRQAVA